MKKSSQYKIGLGDKFLNRASLIFVIMLILILPILGYLIYTEFRSNNLLRFISNQYNKFLASLEKSETVITPKNSVFIYTNRSETSTSSSSVNLTDEVPDTNEDSTQYYYTNDPNPTSQEQSQFMKDFEASQKLNEEKTAESKRQYDQFVKDSNARYDQFVKEGQQGLEDFKNQNP